MKNLKLVVIVVVTAVVAVGCCCLPCPSDLPTGMAPSMRGEPIEVTAPIQASAPVNPQRF